MRRSVLPSILVTALVSWTGCVAYAPPVKLPGVHRRLDLVSSSPRARSAPSTSPTGGDPVQEAGMDVEIDAHAYPEDIKTPHVGM